MSEPDFDELMGNYFPLYKIDWPEASPPVQPDPPQVLIDGCVWDEEDDDGETDPG